MSRIVHFELPAKDPARAQKFYTDALGWSFQKFGEMDYWLITTGPDGTPGINGGMMPHGSDGFTQTVNVVSSEDLDATLAKVTAAGGAVTVPRMAVPTVGWLAYVADTEGNLFGIMQFDESAA